MAICVRLKSLTLLRKWVMTMLVKQVFPLLFPISKFPPEKAEILAATEKEIDKTERMFRRGLMSEDERYRKVIELWARLLMM